MYTLSRCTISIVLLVLLGCGGQPAEIDSTNARLAPPSDTVHDRLTTLEQRLAKLEQPDAKLELRLAQLEQREIRSFTVQLLNNVPFNRGNADIGLPSNGPDQSGDTAEYPEGVVPKGKKVTAIWYQPLDHLAGYTDRFNYISFRPSPQNPDKSFEYDVRNNPNTPQGSVELRVFVQCEAINASPSAAR